jgi:cell division protein FtsX
MKYFKFFIVTPNQNFQVQVEIYMKKRVKKKEKDQIQKKAEMKGMKENL